MGTATGIEDGKAVRSADTVENGPRQGRLPRWARVRGLDATTSIFVIFSVVFGTFFAFAVPLGWGPDEHAQFNRAFQVASGGIAPQRLPDADGLPQYGGLVPRTAIELDKFSGPPNKVPNIWQQLAPANPAFAAAAGKPVNAPLAVAAFPNTAAYSPLAYVPAVAGLKAAQWLDLSIGQAWKFMRLAQVLAYSLVVAAGLFALRRSRFRWAALAVALLPTAVYQSGVISADPLTTAIAFTFLALLAKSLILTPRTDGLSLARWEFAALLAGAMALPLLKPTYAILSLLLLLLPLRKALQGRRGAWSWRVAGPVAAALAVAGAGLLWWLRLSAGTTEAMGWLRGPSERHLVQPGNQLSFILGHPLDVAGIGLRTLISYDWQYVISFFGQMGYAYGGNLTAPAFAAACSAAAMVLGLVYSERVLMGWQRRVFAILVLLVSVAAVFGTLYLAFSPVRFPFVTGVQGRYFVPLALLGAVVVLQLVPARTAGLRAVGQRAVGQRRVELTVFVLCALALLAAAARYWMTMYVPGYHV